MLNFCLGQPMNYQQHTVYIQLDLQWQRSYLVHMRCIRRDPLALLSRHKYPVGRGSHNQVQSYQFHRTMYPEDTSCIRFRMHC